MLMNGSYPAKSQEGFLGSDVVRSTLELVDVAKEDALCSGFRNSTFFYYTHRVLTSKQPSRPSEEWWCLVPSSEWM